MTGSSFDNFAVTKELREAAARHLHEQNPRPDHPGRGFRVSWDSCSPPSRPGFLGYVCQPKRQDGADPLKSGQSRDLMSGDRRQRAEGNRRKGNARGEAADVLLGGT